MENAAAVQIAAWACPALRYVGLCRSAGAPRKPRAITPREFLPESRKPTGEGDFPPRSAAGESLPAKRSRQLDQRLALDDRIVVREGVKCLDEHRAAAGFDVDIADGSEGHSPAGVEFVEQSFPLAIVRELFLECPEDSVSSVSSWKLTW